MPASCSRATGALGSAGVAWTCVFTSPSFAGQAAAARAGLGYAVMQQAMVPHGLAVLKRWPGRTEAEIALFGHFRLSPAAAALAEFSVVTVWRVPTSRASRG